MSRIQRTPVEEHAIINGPFEVAVRAEMRAQDRHWGPAIDSGHSMPEWMVILSREVGEAVHAAAELHWDDASRRAEHRVAARRELIQIAAVAAQIVAVLDAGTAPAPGHTPPPTTITEQMVEAAAEALFEDERRPALPTWRSYRVHDEWRQEERRRARIALEAAHRVREGGEPTEPQVDDDDSTDEQED